MCMIADHTKVFPTQSEACPLALLEMSFGKFGKHFGALAAMDHPAHFKIGKLSKSHAALEFHLEVLRVDVWDLTASSGLRQSRGDQHCACR